jgi:hypothetical protein
MFFCASASASALGPGGGGGRGWLLCLQKESGSLRSDADKTERTSQNKPAGWGRGEREIVRWCSCRLLALSLKYAHLSAIAATKCDEVVGSSR